MTNSTNSEFLPGFEHLALLSLKHVFKTYQMGELDISVLRDISLDIYQGEFLVMVGPSGSGKTTILNIIGGIDTPTAGSVYFGSQDITLASPGELTRFRRESVGFIFQSYNLIPNLTAGENLLVATEICPDPGDVDDTLELVGLGDRKNHFPSQLSGGEQQRVAIARALVKKPQLLLCDEPTGALDYETGKLVLQLLADLNKRLNMTVVIITHNVAIADIADRVAHLRSGQIVEMAINRHKKNPGELVW